jgi:hypothetical protein
MDTLLARAKGLEEWAVYALRPSEEHFPWVLEEEK